jgi:hypothetical protein
LEVQLSKKEAGMGEKFGIPSWYGLENDGLSELNREYWNLGPSALVEQIVRRDKGMLGHLGAVIVKVQQTKFFCGQDAPVTRQFYLTVERTRILQFWAPFYRIPPIV